MGLNQRGIDRQAIGLVPATDMIRRSGGADRLRRRALAEIDHPARGCRKENRHAGLVEIEAGAAQQIATFDVSHPVQHSTAAASMARAA